MNPDNGQPDPPMPLIDYFDLETGLSKKFSTWSGNEIMLESQIPFQMFAYRVLEKEKGAVNLKEEF